jgi:hypothetical protein
MKQLTGKPSLKAPITGMRRATAQPRQPTGMVKTISMTYVFPHIPDLQERAQKQRQNDICL